MGLSRLLLVYEDLYNPDYQPDLIYFDSAEELRAFRQLILNQFSDTDMATRVIYHVYHSGDEWLRDYGYLEDSDEEEEGE